MPTTILELEAQALSLPPEDRAHLLERLIASFEPESRVQGAWIAEALRREAQANAGEVNMVPGPEALARMRARIA